MKHLRPLDLVPCKGKHPVLTPWLKGQGVLDQGERGRQGPDHLSPYFVLPLLNSIQPGAPHLAEHAIPQEASHPVQRGCCSTIETNLLDCTDDVLNFVGQRCMGQ